MRITFVKEILVCTLIISPEVLRLQSSSLYSSFINLMSWCYILLVK